MRISYPTQPGRITSGYTRPKWRSIGLWDGRKSLAMKTPNLKYHRMLAGYTQNALAEEAGIHRVTLSTLERGRYHVGPHTLKKLADTLHVDTRDLVENGN